MKTIVKIITYVFVFIVTFTVGAAFQLLRDANRVNALFTNEKGRDLVRYRADIEEKHANGEMSSGEFALRMKNLNEEFILFHNS